MLSFTTRGNFIDFKYTEDVYPNQVHLIMTLHNSSKCITWGYGENATHIDFKIDDVTYNEIPITSIYFDGVVMTEQADFKTNIESMFPGLAGGGGSSYLVASVELTDAQIKVMPSTEYTIQAAGGAGTYLSPKYVSIVLDNTAGAYVTGGQVTMEVRVGDTVFGVAAEGAAFEDNSHVWLWMINSSDSSGEPINPTEVENFPIKLVTNDFNTDPFTGGNAANTFKVKVYYVEVDL